MRAVERAVVVSSQTLEVARVSVWLFDSDETTLRCLALYDARTESLTAGQVLDVTRWPRYLAALHSRKFVAAADVHVDARTRELEEHYLVPHGITSMLDAPLYRSGRVAGVVCHEHVGSKREWSERDMEFAGSVSDMLTALFEQAGRLAAEENLRAEQARRARADRMEALGRLAAGVAHDFNGVLAAAMLTADLFRHAETVTPELREQAEGLLQVSEVGKRLIAQLMAFARHQPDQGVIVDAGEVLRAMTPVLETLSHDGAHVTITVSDEPLPVRVDRSQLEQVLLNLALNARDVTPAGGTVAIEIGPRDVDRVPFVALSVSDEGPGIPEDERDRIFEPFYSHKSDGQGTGMGLATVQRIVEQADGTVTVEHRVGGGSTFVVRLPRALEGAAGSREDAPGR